MEYTLSMSFLTESGDKKSISITDAKENLNGADVSALMDLIIKSDIFETSKGSLVSKDSAQVVEKAVKKLEL